MRKTIALAARIVMTAAVLAWPVVFAAAGETGPVKPDAYWIDLAEKLELTPTQAFTLIDNYKGNLEALSPAIYRTARDYAGKRPLSAGFLLKKALIEEMLGNGKKAVGHLTECVKLAPEEGRCYYARARLYRDAGEYDKALADFDAAIRLSPGVAYPRHGRSILYRKQANYRNAGKDFEKFVELAPGGAFKRTVMEKNCPDFSLVHAVEVKGCPSADEYGKAGVRGRIKRAGETGAIKALIPKDCCDWECETYQTKCCTDWECTDYNPSTGECANWKCNEWVDCTKERCRCVELCGESGE
jgi:tetratricopeptide (TPR) repeat protein